MKHSKESFYLKYEKLVYQFLWDCLKNETDREHALEVVRELFQQVWIRVFHSFDSYQKKSEEHIKNSLRITAQNVFSDFQKHTYREHQRNVPAEEILREMASPESIDTALFIPERRKYLKDAVKTLTKEERYLIWEYYFSEREGKETARLLDMNYNTLRTRVDRICKKLRVEMERLMREGGDLHE